MVSARIVTETTITLAAAQRAAHVIGVEIVPPAIADARENARRNGLSNRARFILGDAAAEFERLPIVQDAALLQNILYSGIWTRFASAFRAKQEETP